jgi:diguanylate cyclase (GGDEF)-like protein
MSQLTEATGALARIASLKTLSLLLAATVIVSVVLAVGGFAYTESRHREFVALRNETREARILQQALADAQVAVLTFAGGGQVSLRTYDAGLDTLDRMPERVAAVDAYLSRLPGYTANAVRRGTDELLSAWEDALKLVHAGEADKARDVLRQRQIDAVYATTRDALARYWKERMEVANQTVADDELLKSIVTLGQLGAGFWSLLGIWLIYHISSAEAAGRAAAQRAGDASRQQMAQLFQMADMLQSASGHLDANAVLKATAERLLPGLGGTLYVFNNSRDRLDLSTMFGPHETAAPETIAPSSCWSLKRGKTHVNDVASGCLCCDHELPAGEVVLEIPMSARGELFGLLQVSARGPDASRRLDHHREIAVAVADGMSLALANISLREKLRSQALRDPLTGLYNRRYMEDSLDRLVRLAEREKRSLSAVMIDLDHFKKLNDTYGHAMGDAVLRETAAAIIGCLRESDIACRYGGEELIVILPNCSLADAAAKAETIRARIQDLSGHHGTPVSASLGVSSLPQTASPLDLVSSADAALYAAKKAGRNCVVTAPSKSRPDEAADIGPTLVAAE